MWNNLKDFADITIEIQDTESLGEKRFDEIRGCLDELKTIELYWAFSGLHRLYVLSDTLDRHEYSSFGNTFKRKYLMDQFGIQVNKSLRNTVLFMTNIGTVRNSVAKLIGVLLKIAKQLDERTMAFSIQELKLHDQKVFARIKESHVLPSFSYFHKAFRQTTNKGNIRKAFFLAYDKEACESLPLTSCEALIKQRPRDRIKLLCNSISTSVSCIGSGVGFDKRDHGLYEVSRRKRNSLLQCRTRL